MNDLTRKIALEEAQMVRLVHQEAADLMRSLADSLTTEWLRHYLYCTATVLQLAEFRSNFSKH